MAKRTIYPTTGFAPLVVVTPPVISADKIAAQPDPISIWTPRRFNAALYSPAAYRAVATGAVFTMTFSATTLSPGATLLAIKPSARQGFLGGFQDLSGGFRG